MPSVTNKGGHISQNANPDNYAGVDQATATQTGPAAASWVVTLTNVPTVANFQVGQALTYNSKGTRNPNADNNLTVTSVNGPTKYTCNGNWPMNT
jgi:hypothetical protein